MQLRSIFISACLLLGKPFSFSQSFVYEQSNGYLWPDDPLVVRHLQEWQDLKFGIILHWGLYSVPGICESWTLTSEDWITPDPVMSYDEYKKWYWGLINDFNPVHFNPEQWAEVAADAGMKYMVFTTKHHDGFCLFDSKQTDFTVMYSPFGTNPRADATRYVFDAFRQRGMMVGCYFSKPDWHSQDYWWDKRATYNRMHNYPTAQYPERWANYRSFVYNQVDELMSGYGPVDILWLDGGWCTAPREDIGLDSIVENARSKQPGLIVVERSCPGKHENYQTPEQRIPERQILNPWESCITLTNDWGWTDHPVFKSPAKVIATLAEVVAKGGSLLLGVGPTPDGVIEEGAVSRLRQIGKWLQLNGAAIYNTRSTPVYTNASNSVWFTADQNGRTLYAIIPQDSDGKLPSTVEWKGNVPAKGKKMRLLSTGTQVRWKTDESGTTQVVLPESVVHSEAAVLVYEQAKEK